MAQVKSCEKAIAALPKALDRPEALIKVAGSLNLYVHVRKTGSICWFFRKTIGGKTQKKSLGSWPITTLDDAAILDRQMNREIRNGVDPRTFFVRRERAEMTFDDALNLWLKGRADVTQATVSRIGREVRENLSDLLTVQIRHLDSGLFQAAISPLWSRPIGPAILGHVKHIWAHGVDALNLDVNIDAETAKLKRLLGKAVRIKKNQEMMAPADLPIWLSKLRTSNTLPTMTKIAAELIILTNKRPSEILAAKWDEIDFDNALWTIPASRLKMEQRQATGANHVMPLAARVMDLLKAWKSETGGIGDLFTKKTGTPFNKNDLNQSLRNHCPLPTGTTGGKATVHGTARATFSTWANDQGYSSSVIETQLGHKIGNETQQSYDRSNRLDLRRELVEAYATFTQ